MMKLPQTDTPPPQSVYTDGYRGLNAEKGVSVFTQQIRGRTEFWSGVTLDGVQETICSTGIKPVKQNAKQVLQPLYYLSGS